MARRRNIYDSSYQTPLADFLDQIPDYFIRYEQLKQAEADRVDRKSFRDKQYSDSINQQNLNNQYRNEQAIKQERNTLFNNHTKLMQGMPDYQKAQYIDKVLQKDPALKDYMDFSQFEDFSKNIKDANTEYDNINSNVDDFRGSSTLSMFPRYNEVVDTYQQLQNMEKSVRGTDLELSHAKDLKYIGGLKKDLETLSGREYIEKDIPKGLKNTWSLYESVAKKTQNEFIETETELSKYAIKTAGEDGKEAWLVQPSRGDKVTEQDKNAFMLAKRQYDLARGRANQMGLRFQNFAKDNNLFYPEIQTAKQLEELDRQSEELNRQSEARTSWFNENERYVNQDPESAELALRYLDDPTNADRFSALQESVSNRKSYEDWNKQMEEEFELVFAEDGSLKDKTKIVKAEDTREPYEKGAMSPATEFEPGADIADEDIDAVLADVRETTGFYPEGDAPKSESQIPPALEPLKARSNAEREAVVKEKEKEAQDSELFENLTDVETLKSTKEYNVADIKKSDDDSARARRYIGYGGIGKDFKQLVALRENLSSLEKRGNPFNIKQVNDKIFEVENKIRKAIGKFINPETGELSDERLTSNAFSAIKSALPGSQYTREMQDFLREFSTATPAFSKKDKKAFTSS